MNEERERLIKKLVEYDRFDGSDLEGLADFILDDRQRIIEPLYNLRYSKIKFIDWKTACEKCHKAIDETLKNAGVIL